MLDALKEIPTLGAYGPVHRGEAVEVKIAPGGGAPLGLEIEAGASSTCIDVNALWRIERPQSHLCTAAMMGAMPVRGCAGVANAVFVRAMFATAAGPETHQTCHLAHNTIRQVAEVDIKGLVPLGRWKAETCAGVRMAAVVWP